MIPSPPCRTAAPEREAGAGPAPTPQPLAPAGTTKNKRTRVNTTGRHTDRARGQQASTNQSSMGATPSMARATPRTPALLPTQGRQRDGPRQGDPEPNWPPPAAQSGGTAHRPPAPPPHPTPQARRPTPQGAHSPKPGRGETGPGRPPPQASQTEHGTGAGHGEGQGPCVTALPAPSTGTTRGARATPTRGVGGGRKPGERKRTHTQRTRGEYQKGNQTEPAERTDRMECRTSERG